MKLHIMSDLHLEFGKMEMDPIGDVLILAGDIHVGNKATDFIRQVYDHYKLIIYVMGNHEFYGQDYHEVLNWWQKTNQFWPKLQVLHNEAINFDGVRFIGTTLWTYGDKAVLNDYNLIWYNGRILQVKDTQQFHHEAVQFLLDEFEKPFEGETVVVTHHAPIPECVVPKYNGAAINCMFHANLNEIIKDNDILAWIHGHMHDTIVFDYEDTKIICNPRGYVGHGANWGFTQDLVLDTETQNLV